MSSLRQVLTHPGRPLPAAAPHPPGDRRSHHDRRAALERRRNNVLPFESREMRMRFAAQAAGFGVYDLDCATGDSVWSPELRTMAGLAPDRSPLTTEQAESLIHPEDRERFMEKLRASLEPEGSGEFEDVYRLLRPDGTVCWVRTKGRTFFADNGQYRIPVAATGIVMDLTASRAADQRLAESREELEKMVESAIDGIITIDGDQRIIRYNPSAARMFGYSAEEMVGRTVEDLMPERYRAEHPEKVRRVAEGSPLELGLNVPRRFIGLRRDGEEFPFESTVTKVEVAGHLRLTTFMRDITERERAQEDIRRSKEDLELAVRGANIGIWHFDVKTDEVEWSERQYQLFGLPVGEPMNVHKVMDRVHPDDRETIRAARRRALEDGDELNVEFRVFWPDGTLRWLQSIGRIVFYQRGSGADGLRGITLDITDRRNTEEALRRSKADLELAVQGANIGVWHWDMRTREAQLSERCHQLFGLPFKDNLTCDDIAEVIHPDDRPSVAAALRRTLDDGAEYKLEHRCVWPDGSIHWLECIGRELWGENGSKPVGLRGIALDITERKCHEEALEHSREELEARVQERTLELVRANEALERSNLELQQFAFIAAHDLQTPLRSISGFAQLLQQDYGDRLDPQANGWLGQLVRSSRRMHELTHDLLSYSRVESRGSAFQPIDCNELFGDVVEILEAPIRETGAQVTRDDLPTVVGDRTQLGQVLQNLIDNGLKYRGREPPRIHISAERQEDHWVFSVRDNGIGIPEKHLDHIFDIFRRLHTQQEYPGTGIGLAICRRVIHRHGGRIWAESRAGEGSAFCFTLPVANGDTPSP